MNRRPCLRSVADTLRVAAAVVLMTPLAVSAQDPRADLLVDADWLMENLDQPGLVVIHVERNEEGLAEAKVIPGSTAIHLDQISVSSMEEGRPHVMLDLPARIEDARRAFEEAGVSDDSRVVLTWDDGRFPNATRAMWTLQILGKETGVSVLDGGLAAWSAAGGELAQPNTATEPGRMAAEPRMDRRVDAAFVLAQGEAPGIGLVDARRTVSWDGTRPEMPGRAGHIPGAGSLPQVDLYTEEGLLKPASELLNLFELAGVREGDQVVAYCHIGYWASAVVFAARTLGMDAVLYDGSMTEWAADEDLPLVLPRER